MKKEHWAATLMAIFLCFSFQWLAMSLSSCTLYVSIERKPYIKPVKTEVVKIEQVKKEPVKEVKKSNYEHQRNAVPWGNLPK